MPICSGKWDHPQQQPTSDHTLNKEGFSLPQQLFPIISRLGRGLESFVCSMVGFCLLSLIKSKCAGDHSHCEVETVAATLQGPARLFYSFHLFIW